ncbi:MAG: Hint domain-containing protein [Cyanobacteria bacterium P01_F01_bin.150]
MAAAGDIAFVGFNADGNDGFSIVVVSELDGSAEPLEINFTDNEWEGSAFADLNEGILSWTIDGVIPANTVINFTNVSTTPEISSDLETSVGTVTGLMNITTANEALYAVEGIVSEIEAPTSFLAAIANDSDILNLDNTGLTLGQTAVEISGDADFLVYIGDRNMNASELLASINNSANWEIEDGPGDQSNDGIGRDLPFESEPFECFLTGTRLLTDIGEKRVEELAIGDRLQTLDGTLEKIKWIGIQTCYNNDKTNHPLRTYPIKVKAGALGPNCPIRDLYVSPDHALLVEGILVNAGAMENGDSIVQIQPTDEAFIYYHIELERHSILIADGAPAESYLPQKQDRNTFDNGAEYRAMYPDSNMQALLPMNYPRVSSKRQLPRFIAKHIAKCISTHKGRAQTTKTHV